MTDQELTMKLQRLFQETGRAHHQAFLATNGDDPEWPAWYADYLAPRLASLFGHAFLAEELTVQLKALEDKRQKEDPSAEWALYYARHLAVASGKTKLSP